MTQEPYLRAGKLQMFLLYITKRQKNEPGNYRTISLSSVVCKLMEKIIRSWVVEHLLQNNCISNKQYGFLPGRSTTTQLLSVIECWTESLDRGSELDVLYFDFVKAFDTVPHRRLMSKTAGYGVNENTTRWITNFLTNRSQRVVVKGCPSDWRNVTSGVPQGSVLGPTLFVLYINDLPSTTLSSLWLFADDAKLTREIKNNEDRKIIQSDINEMLTWSDRWLLKFQPPKCKAMHISRRGKEEQRMVYKMNGTEIECVTSEKDIGIIIDRNLSFDKHITTTAKKANKIMGVIRRSYSHLDETNFKFLFRGLVRPHLEYAQAVWQPHKKGQIRTLESVQRRATKQIPSLRHLSYEERLKQLKLPTLAYRRLRGDMIEVFKITHSIYDQSTTQHLLQPAYNNTTRGHPFKLKKRHSNLDIRLHSFSHRIVNNWNSLPEETVTSKTILSFEKHLDRAWENHPLKWDPEEPQIWTKRPYTPAPRNQHKVT